MLDRMVGEIRSRTAVEARITPGRPYSAEAITESTQVLADGNRIARKSVTRIYRDSEGRTRREQMNDSGVVESVSIVDPVAHTSFVLQPQTRTAYQRGGARIDGARQSKMEDRRRVARSWQNRQRRERAAGGAGQTVASSLSRLPRSAAPMAGGRGAHRRTAERRMREELGTQRCRRGRRHGHADDDDDSRRRDRQSPADQDRLGAVVLARISRCSS